jgi:phosphoserine phosphatase RsbU/P
VLDEIWITDEKGHAYLRNITEINFTFSPDQEKQPQAHVFWSLLTGKNKSVVQEARQREIDTQVFKYVGVAGVDKPRIVQVGYHAIMLQQLRQRMGLTRLVNQLVSEGSVIAIRVLDRNMISVDYTERFRGDKLPEPTESELANFRKLVSEGRSESYLEGSLLKVAAPIGEEGGELKGGAILVTLPTDHVQAAIRNQTRLAMAVSGLVLLFGLVIGVFGARTIARPIVDLTEMTRRIASGDFTQRIVINAKNEVGVLAASFNEMTRRLNESIEHLKETTAAKERIESELKIAHDIQMSMVPKTFPPFPDRREFDIYATLIPAREVGGDFYDFFFIDEHRLCFAIGDVSGKGVPASLFMALTKTMFRATGGRQNATAEIILSRLNEEICRDNDSCMFVTVFCCILDVRTGQVEYSNAGHNLPYVLSNGVVRALPKTWGMALGAAESADFHAGQVLLKPGDRLVLYTDGVTEAMDENDELFSESRLETTLQGVNGLSSKEVIERVVKQVERFSTGAAQSDDITLLALGYNGLNETNHDTLSVMLKNDLAELQRLTQLVTEFAQHHGLASELVFRVTLVLEEIITNVISYAYEDDLEHEIEVRLYWHDPDMKLEVQDDGRPFNPLETPPPDIGKPMAERQVGGLGIHLVREMMDELEYRRENDKNFLVLQTKIREI